MEPLALKPKRGFRKLLSKTSDKLLGRSPPGSSQRPPRAPSVQSSDLQHTSGSKNSPILHVKDSLPADTIAQPLAKAQSGPPAIRSMSTCSPNGPLANVEASTGVESPPIIESPPIDSLPVVEPLLAVESPSFTKPLPTVEPPLTVGPLIATMTSTANAMSSTPAILASRQNVEPALLGGRKNITGVWKPLDTALRALCATTSWLPPIQSAISSFLPCLDIIQETCQDRQEYKELGTELISITESLAQHLHPSTPAYMSNSITKIARAIEEQSRLIDGKRNRGIGSCLLEANTDADEIASCYRQIQSLFRQLQIDASLSMWSVVNDQMTDARLAELAPAKLASYDSKLSTGINRRTCTEGTRVAILSGLSDWLRDPTAADIYWMNGMAGTGKTTIACTFAESLDELKQLAASFFCTRTVPECRDVNRIIPTIAYQLAQYSIPYRSELCQTLGSDPNIGAKNIVKQFERLLKEPLLKVKEAIPNSLVVAIDALDECDDMVEVELLLSVLLKSAADLPLRFFVTSRPESEIYNKMLARGQGQRTVMHLHEVEKSLVRADIELYLEAELESVSPTPAQVKELARRSGTLFIYAATLVRYIRFRKAQADPQRRLHDVLSVTSETNRPYAELDALYAAVIKVALDEDGLLPEEIECVRRVLQTVVCIQEPVSAEVIAALTGVDSETRVLAALQPLRAVLYCSETTGLVSTLHASFSDFLFDEARSGPLYCNLTAQSELVTRSCFDIMKLQLKFNICGLKSSFVCDCDIPDLDARVERAISPALWYACRYWSRHLGLSANYSKELSTLLKDFLLVRLLFWMEVLNLKREMGTGVDMLFAARTWIQAGSSLGTTLMRLTQDASIFVTIYASNPVSISTPHIYFSLLPFCPRPNSVFERYWSKTNGLIKATGSATQKGRTLTLARWETRSPVLAVSYSPDTASIAVGHDDGTITVRNIRGKTSFTGPLKGHVEAVKSVAYAPDGTRFVSGSWDMTIRVWNAHDGTLVTGPLTGHTGYIQSVSYSPHSTRIVSGSFDTTIRVWNAHDGTSVGSPLKGHTGRVNSAVYSPDGRHVVSGSSDKTIRVWDTQDGTSVIGPFEGHTDSVNSVAYSPEGTHIVSGSSDKTIRVWNAHDGTSITSPLMGHTGMIQSVAYSPDGRRIVSSSSDTTICIWDARDGVLMSSPLKAHTDSVQSVVCSSDGSYIISGSYDKSIQIWNACNSPFTADSFEHMGHTDSIWSVVYSPDGARIASGSDDKTVRVWNAHNGASVAGPLKGHAGPVYSVAYSPDGTQIVSSSADKTVRVWNAHDGTPVTGPLEGHTWSVYSVAYSPDSTRIVSGSYDETIRVWSSHDGTLVAGPLEGHTDLVYSVAYSPDGTGIASGSGDKTIRVWNTCDGTPVTRPFEGHTGSVRSVAYSPDGTRVVSGSWDNTIRVWNAHDGTLAAGPLLGHTRSVTSIACSPDGTRIVTGSDDETIRFWSMHDGAAILAPLEGHTGSVRSVAYSPDGTRIVSGSSDNTIRVWNVETRAPLALSAPLLQLSSPLVTNDDGWAVDAHQNLLFWVPPELRYARISPRCDVAVVIDGENGTLGVDYGDVLFGPRWDQCYLSE